jgi:hypothetical protein
MVNDEEVSEKLPPMNELGSSFSWDDSPFGGYDKGRVFAYEELDVPRYQEMLDTDGKAASIEKLLSYPIIAAGWEIDPAKGDSGEAEFIYDALTALPHQGGPKTTIEQLVSQMTMAFTHRRAYFEKVFKINDDNMVVYDKIAWRPPETCELALDAKTGEPQGFRQLPVHWDPYPHVASRTTSQGDWKYIRPKKAFVYVHGTWRDPLLGFSQMKLPYWCYITKRKIRWLWYQFLENTSLPKVIVQNQDELQARADAKLMSTLRSRGLMGMNSESTFSVLESSGKGAESFIEAIRFLDSEMSNSILAGFMDLTSQAAEGKGSYALSESQGKLFLRTRRMVARDMARQLTNDVVGPLIRYNFGPNAPVPRFAFGPLSEQNEQAVLDMFAKVATTGAKVPVEFYDQLTTRTATLLELDPGKVAKDIKVNGSPLLQMGAAVDEATNMVAGAKNQTQSNSSTVGTKPFGTESVVANKKFG